MFISGGNTVILVALKNFFHNLQTIKVKNDH